MRPYMLGVVQVYKAYSKSLSVKNIQFQFFEKYKQTKFNFNFLR